jgi:hypothetical protein
VTKTDLLHSGSGPFELLRQLDVAVVLHARSLVVLKKCAKSAISAISLLRIFSRFLFRYRFLVFFVLVIFGGRPESRGSTAGRLGARGERTEGHELFEGGGDGAEAEDLSLGAADGGSAQAGMELA